jgi:hypothetical protein
MKKETQHGNSNINNSATNPSGKIPSKKSKAPRKKSAGMLRRKI